MNKFLSIIAPGLITTANIYASSFASPANQGNTNDQPKIYKAGKCAFTITDLHGGAFSVDNESHIKGGVYSSSQDWSFSIHCLAGASQDAITDQLDAKKIGPSWIWSATEKPFSPSQNFKSYDISGKNWTGRVTRYDAITGEESTRQLTFLFCLNETRGTQVLCGQAPGLTQGIAETEATIPKIIDVLKDIEFVDLQPGTVTPTKAGRP